MKRNQIIFDFDHTLVELGPHVDWRRAIEEIESIYLKEGIPPKVLEQSRGVGFKLMRTVYDFMLEALPSDRTQQIQGRVFDALESYELQGAGRAKPLQETEPTLSWLRSKGYPCAIVTSNGTAAVGRILECLGISDCFNGVFGRDPPCRLKPYPDQNQACLTSLGWSAEETLLVGDSPDDILSAKPLSIFTVGVVSGLAKKDRLVEAGANRIIASLGELPSVVQTGS